MLYKSIFDIPQKIIKNIDWDITVEDAFNKDIGNDNTSYYFLIDTNKDSNKLYLVKKIGWYAFTIGRFNILDKQIESFQNKDMIELTKTQVAYLNQIF